MPRPKKRKRDDEEEDIPTVSVTTHEVIDFDKLYHINQLKLPYETEYMLSNLMETKGGLSRRMVVNTPKDDHLDGRMYADIDVSYLATTTTISIWQTLHS